MQAGLSEISIDLTEFNKLKKLLIKHEIPFEERTIDGIKGYEHHQIIYPCDGEQRKSDAVIGLGTYGYQHGLLEQMGLIPQDECLDDVQGWLDAETIFKRWAEDFGFFVKGMDI